MGLGILVLKVKHTPFKGVDYMGILILVIPLVLPSIGHMHMAVEEKFRMVLFNQAAENLESLMRQVSSVIELVGRRVSHQNVKAAVLKKLEPELFYALIHLFFGILMRTWPVTHGTAQP